MLECMGRGVLHEMHVVCLLYDMRMAQEFPDLRALQYFVAVVDSGTFTDAAISLGVSQAAVSRTVAGLERSLGAKLLRRLPRGAEPTSLGRQILPEARRTLQQARQLTAIVRDERRILRLGHAWSAVGRYTTPLLRGWKRDFADTELRLLRYNTATGGLREGIVDAAIIRVPVRDPRIATVQVGAERRFVAFATDDAWRRRRTFKLAELRHRPILVDDKTGTTSADLWTGEPPQLIATPDVDEWLDGIAAGDGIGVTAEATIHHNPRPGVSYRLVGDAPAIPVQLAWWADDPPERIDDLRAMLCELYRSPRA